MHLQTVALSPLRQFISCRVCPLQNIESVRRPCSNNSGNGGYDRVMLLIVATKLEFDDESDVRTKSMRRNYSKLQTYEFKAYM